MTSNSNPSEALLPVACLAAFTRTGQDKAAVQRLIDALAADLVPRNLMERVWIRDLAVLTIRSEELRLVQVAVHKLLVERTEASSGTLPPAQPATAAPAGPGHCDIALERLLGLTYTEHLAVLDAIAHMEADVRHDRDRVMSVFDQRRGVDMNAVLNTVSAVMAGTYDV